MSYILFDVLQHLLPRLVLLVLLPHDGCRVDELSTALSSVCRSKSKDFIAAGVESCPIVKNGEVRTGFADENTLHKSSCDVAPCAEWVVDDVGKC